MTESSSPERLEAANSNNKPSKKTPMSSATFLQQFVHDYVDTRPAAMKNELIEEAMTKDTLSGTKVAQGLAEFRASDEKYNDVNISETGEGAIDIAMVRRYLAKGYVQTKKAREDFEKKVLKDYDLTPEEYATKLAASVNGLSHNEISRLMRSEYKLSTFLKQKLGKTVLSKVRFDMLAGVSDAQMQDRMRKMKDPDKTEIGIILQKLQNGKIPTQDQMKHLIVSSLFDEKQKVQFIHQYLPFITLQQALDIELIQEGKAKQIIQEYVRDAIAEKKISAENTDKMVDLLKPQDIQVATKDLIRSANDIEALIEGVGFEDFVSDLEEEAQDTLENLRSSGPKSFEGLKASLAQLGERKCQNTMLFDRGNILQVTKMQSGGEKDVHYVRIGDYDDEKKEFTYQKLGGPQINLKNRTEYDTIRYEDFFANVSKDSGTSFIALTPETVQLKIQSKEIISTELQSYVPEDLAGDDKAQKRQEIQAQEIQSLQDELAQEREKASKDANSDAAARVKTLENELKKAQETEYDLDTLSYLANKFSLLEKINELDPEGSSLGLKRGVAFQIGKGEKANTYTIDSFDHDTEEIRFHSRAGSESIKFGNFLTGFQEKKAKRVKSITSEGELVAGFGENFELKDGEVIQKDAQLNGEKKDRTVEYMSDGKHKLVKIVSLSGGYVEFQEGEIHDAEDHGHGKDDGHGHGHGHGKEEKKYSLKIKGAQVQKWTLDEFHRYISEEELKADWKLGQSYEEHPQDAKNPTHGSFVDKFMKGISLYELMHGGEMVVEGITEALHNGSHAKSAHAALAMAKWLPGELRDEMRMKVEAAEAEETEGAKKKLGSIDSWMAVARIEKWLLNRDTPQYKLEAGALFMMEKYGHLTAKGGLYPYRGKFFWYERLGGRIGDELYNEVMSGMSEDDQSFAEERLVHQLFKKQCDERKHHYSGIHRRSRVHKEFENAWKSGISGELEKGEKDAGAFRGSSRMAKEGMDEAKGGTSSNAFGWAKKAAAKGTAKSEKDYMLIPAAFLMSGACYDMDQATYTNVKAFWDGEGIPVIAFRMFGDNSKMNIFRDTVLELSKEIEKAYPGRFPNIYAETQKLYTDGKNRTGKERDRLQRSEDYWNTYGDVLTRALNMSLESDVGGEKDFSMTDTIIRRKRKENSVFDTYYKLVRGAVGEGNAFKEEYVDDWVGETGFFGLNPHDLILKHMILSQDGGFRNKSIGPKVWEKFANDINATPQKILVAGETVDSPINRKAQEEYIAELLEEITGSFYEMFSQRTEYTYGLNRATSNIGEDLNKWGLRFESVLGEVSAKSILDGQHRSKFEGVARNIISGKGNAGSFIAGPDIFKQVKTTTQTGIAENLAGNPRGI